MNFREALLDPAEHLFVPVNLEIGMQAALHKHARAAEFDGLSNLLVDRVEVEDVALFGRRPLERTIESAEGAVFRAEVGVVNVAVDDVGDGALGMQASAD